MYIISNRTHLEWSINVVLDVIKQTNLYIFCENVIVYWTYCWKTLRLMCKNKYSQHKHIERERTKVLLY